MSQDLFFPQHGFPLWCIQARGMLQHHQPAGAAQRPQLAAAAAAAPGAVVAAGAPPKPAANWVMGDVMAHCKEARDRKSVV
jgi:hypothetical protein